MAPTDYLSYYLDPYKRWSYRPFFDPEHYHETIRISTDLPDPETVHHREGEVVVVLIHGVETQATITGIYCYLKMPEKTIEIYYDLYWTGTGHTHGFFKEDVFIQR